MPQQLVPYWNALKRWWWLVLVSILLAGIGAYAYWQVQPPVYEARIALIVGSSARSANPNAQQLGIERTLAAFYGEMTKRHPITHAVIERLGLPLSPEQLGKVIFTNVIYDAQILEIYVYDVDPRQAAILATTIAEELIRQSPAAAPDEGSQEFVKLQIADLQQKIADVDAQLADLRSRMAQMTSTSALNEARAAARELDTLKLNYSATYAQYLSVLDDRNANSLSIIEPASVSSQPVSMSLTTALLIAAAGGLALSAGAILVLEYSDDVLRWDDAPTALSLPVLGALPKWGDRQHPLILSAQPHSPEADALRSLRVRIGLGGERLDIRKIAVTSPSPRDGKTFTAVNLAAAAAAAGLRTILVDGDLRLGDLHAFLGCASEPGLSDVLRRSGRGSTSLETAIQVTPIENLYLVAAGRPALDPASLLTGTKLETFIRTLLARADLVVIDTPPVSVGPDAALLATAADAVVLVASAGRTRRRTAVKAIAALERYNLIGLVFNRVLLARSYGRYYRYYSRRGVSTPRTARNRNLAARLLARLRLKSSRASKRTSFGPTAATDLREEDEGRQLVNNS